MPEYFLIRVVYGKERRDVFMERFTDITEAEERYAEVYDGLGKKRSHTALYLSEGRIRHNPFVKWPVRQEEKVTKK